jgi:hypothetical protein
MLETSYTQNLGTFRNRQNLKINNFYIINILQTKKFFFIKKEKRFKIVFIL